MSRPFCSHVAMLQDGASSGVLLVNKLVLPLVDFKMVQFWSEIKLVIINRTPASGSCDIVITRLISDQIALHLVHDYYYKSKFYKVQFLKKRF